MGPQLPSHPPESIALLPQRMISYYLPSAANANTFAIFSSRVVCLFVVTFLAAGKMSIHKIDKTILCCKKTTQKLQKLLDECEESAQKIDLNCSSPMSAAFAQHRDL